jgi:gliding motility-associated-like protein
MRTVSSYFLFILLLILSEGAFCQVDNDPPSPPVLNFLTVQPSIGKPELKWSKSPSPDVAGYVLYYFTNGEGHAFDTIYDPNVTSFLNQASNSQYWIESYVIAAIDTAGNISPLSNELHTIYPIIKADSCKASLKISWNSYPSYPLNVTGYTIEVSENNGSYFIAGHVGASTDSFDLEGIKPSLNYCIIIRADLEGGMASTSVIKCRQVKMERAPDWMNADYATVDGNNNISLSFTIDPLSEIKTFWINRRRFADNDFVTLTNTLLVNNNITFTDESADVTGRYSYWLLAINRCGVALENSNVAGNILLQLSDENDKLYLSWNSYNTWNGGIRDYTLYMNTGNGYAVKSMLLPADTTCTIDYHDIMNDVSDARLCFYIEATEITNQYGITGKSRSNTVCMLDIEKITVPNAFTPDNDNLNDLFKPVLSFTPLEYQLIITDRQNNKVFETTDPLQSWDGTKGGSVLPADVYLWYLKLKTPSGKIISKTGTIAIVKTR